MNNQQTISLEPAQVPARLRGAYNGRKFCANVCERHELRNTYWSGGTRSAYHMVILATGERVEPQGIAAPCHFGGTLEGREVSIPPGAVLVEHSIFCGKDMGLWFYVNPADVAALLPKPADASQDQLIVLAATASYKNTYGGRTEIRFAEAHESTGITREAWDAAKSQCVTAGLLNSQGAITVKGKNTLGSRRLGYRGQGLRE